MRRPLNLLDDLRIASPCSADWDAMAGDERARHCGQCDRMVYDVSSLTQEEALDLFEHYQGPGRVPCVRLFRRRDGTVLTADCPVGLRRKMWWLVGVLGGLAASLVGFVLFAFARAGGSAGGPTVSTVTVGRPARGEVQCIMGEPIVPPQPPVPPVQDENQDLQR